ncbi:hypothetical protein [Nocardioides sp. NPDC006273]|uniref:hypothetical protein n=1 Tax=Nocardioides sp. NPDC006273 TaxID=3155598 RepID=UPI0033B65AD3
MLAYGQSKIAVGLFGLDLDRRSRANAWGITSNLSHPGVAPTNLLAARPEIGRTTDTLPVRMIRWLSARGDPPGHPRDRRPSRTAGRHLARCDRRPALRPQRPRAPRWRPRRAGALPPLASGEDAARLWEISESLTRTALLTS